MSLVIHNLKHLSAYEDRLLAWERSTYEIVEACCAADQATSLHNKNNDALAKRPSLSADFLKLFHQMLPQELRDLVYAHVLNSENETWTFQPPGLYFRFNRRTADAPTRIIPRCLQTTRDPIFSIIRQELAKYFFATNTIVLRYRYDSATLDILTDFCRHTGCCGLSRYMKRLQILFCPPESAEDDMFCDEEAEFEWHHMFPRPKNARALALREQLWADLHYIDVYTNKESDVEFTFMISEQEWQASIGPGGMDEWLGGYKYTHGLRIKLLWHDWEKMIA